MAGDFNMAGFAMMRAKHCGVLGEIDVNSHRVNSHQIGPLAEGTTGVTISHRSTPLRVLASPYRARLLALKGYYIDKNQVIRRVPNFNFAPMATLHEDPSRDSEFASSLPTGTPRTPSLINPLTGVALARDSQSIPQEASAADCINIAASTLDSFASVSAISDSLYPAYQG